MQILGSAGLGWKPDVHMHRPLLRVRGELHERQPLGETSEQVLHETWQGRPSPVTAITYSSLILHDPNIELEVELWKVEFVEHVKQSSVVGPLQV